jgi:type I restriction enzyme S subunit
MSEWKEYKLEDVCLKITDGSHFSPKVDPNGKRIIGTVKDMLDYSFDIENCKKINEEEYDKLLKNDCKPKHNDILFSKDGTIGKVIVFDWDLDIVILSSIAIIRPNTELINPKFLAYILKSKKSQEEINENYKSGSAIPRVILRDFKRFPISIPDLQTQTSIAEILSSLDDKIELNNKINQELETLAQTLFKQWFIDFEFPNENGEPYKSSGGEMVESEFGEIPKGWVVSKFGDLVDIINGYAFKSKDFNDMSTEGILKIRNINGTVVDIVNTDYVSSEVVSKLNNKFKIKAGDILIAMTGAEVGKIGVTPESDKSLWLNQRVGKVVPKNKTQVSFIHTMFNVLNLTEIVRNEAMGSAQPNISSQGIENIKLLIPSTNLINEYSAMFIDKFELFYKSLGENQELVDLRDNLLPKLISGELEINKILN